jgi:hypothetical protein
MKIGTKLGIFAGVAVFAAATLVAAADQSITLYNGTVLNARLNQTLDSGAVHVGDQFTMTVVPPYPSGDPNFQGATIGGEVTRVVPAGQGRNPEIVIQPRSLNLYGGGTVEIDGNVTSIAANKNNAGQTAGKAALGALAGMLIGNAFGKTIFHASGFGAVGLIGGAMLGANSKSNFTIPPGAQATVQLTQTVTMRRQASSAPY